MIHTFIQKHTDLLYVLLTGGGYTVLGFTELMGSLEAIIRVLVGLATLGYILYKSYSLYKKNKNGEVSRNGGV